ncbi:MAG: hypothetical protein WBQ72_02655, partial [Terriglobales bacterium]
MIWVKFRFTSGRASTCSVVTTSPSAFVLVSTTGGVPFTSTAVSALLTLTVTFSTFVSVTAITTEETMVRAKPFASMS